MISETLAAAVVHRRELWFGRDANVGARLASTAEQLDIDVNVLH